MALWEDIFREHSALGGAITARAAPTPEASAGPEEENPFMRAIHGIGRGISYLQKPADILASAVAGLPDPIHNPATVGQIWKDALIPEGSGIAGTALEAAPGLGLVGAYERFTGEPSALGRAAAGVGRAAAETVGNTAVNPLTYASFGSGALGRVAATGFGALGAVQGIEGAQQAGEVLRDQGLTPEAIEAATSAGLGLGMAGLGLKHALRGPEPFEVAAKVRPKTEAQPTAAPEVAPWVPRETVSVAPEPQPEPAPVIEERAPEDRRAAEVPVAEDRRLLTRRRIASEVGLPEDHPAVERAAAAEDRALEAETDPTTGLPGRIAFNRDAATHSGALVSLDADGLKFVNDNLGGHPAGDAFLKALGVAVKSEPSVRGYRAGESGDEIYLLADSPEAGQGAAESIRDRFLNARFKVTKPDGSVVEYTGGQVSHGVAPTSPESLASAKLAADAELYDRRRIAEGLGRRNPERGGRPPLLAEVPAGGEQVRGDLASQGAVLSSAAPVPSPVEPVTVPEAASVAPPSQPPAGPPPKGPIKPIPPTPTGGETEALRSLISQAKPARAAQEKLYSAERSKRFGAAASELAQGTGEAAFKAAMGKLGGELPKASFDPVRAGLSEEQVNNLYDSVRTAKLSPAEKVRTGAALRKLLDPDAPQIPQPNELALLSRTFGPKLVEAIEAKRPSGVRLRENALSILSTPRTILSSFDMSAPLRQGLVLTVAHPGKAASAFGEMVKSFASPASFERLKDDILLRPSADLHDESGLYISMKHGAGLEGREEAFASKLVQKIPGVRASERAYAAYLDKLRADVFDSTIETFKKAGRDLEAEPELAQSLATYINHATGRGDLGALNSSAVLLNSVFFSPRFMAARLRMFDPRFYAKMEPTVRRQAVGDMLKLAGVGIGLLSLAKMGGAEVETDPHSSDFGKMRFGKTRIDPWGGFQPWIRFGAQMWGTANPLEGKLGTGLRKKLSGVSAAEPRLDIAARFATQKLSPTAGLVVDLLRGKTSIGEDTSLDLEAYQRLVPLFIQDVIAVSKENPELAGGVGAAGFFGAGVQTYSEPSEPTPMERYLKDELDRLGYTPEEPSSHTTIRGHRMDLNEDEVRVLKKSNMKASDEARRLIRSSSYRRLSDEDREYALKQVFEKWRSRGHSRIRSGIQSRYRQLPKQEPGPEVAVG